MRGSRYKLTDEIGHFTAMPEVVIERWGEIGTDAVALFLYLRYRTNRERGDAWPGYDRIQADIGWGRRRIKNGIDALEDADLLSRTKRFGKSTIYRLKLPPGVGEASAARPPDVGEDRASSSPLPPDVGVSDDEAASSRDLELLDEEDESRDPRLKVTPSSRDPRPQKSRSATEEVADRDSTQTQFTQTEGEPERSNSRPSATGATEFTRKEKDGIRRRVAEHFSERTKLPLPEPKTEKERLNAARLWYQPIRKICELVEWREEHAVALVDACLDRLLPDCTISNPNSISNTAQAIIAEVKRGAYRPEGEPVGYSAIRQWLQESVG